MNNKGFLGGDLLVYIYSIIALAVIGVLFFGLFTFLNAKQPEISTNVESPKISAYEYLDYYLNTKIRVTGKETSLKELIPLYCFSKNEETNNFIKKISEYLIPSGIFVTFECSLDCKQFIGSDYKKVINLPGFTADSNACIIAEVVNYDPNRLIESINSDKNFENRINQGILRDVLISPYKDLWLNNADQWCNPIEDNCSKKITKNNLIECKGDYKVCKEL